MNAQQRMDSLKQNLSCLDRTSGYTRTQIEPIMKRLRHDIARIEQEVLMEQVNLQINQKMATITPAIYSIESFIDAFNSQNEKKIVFTLTARSDKRTDGPEHVNVLWRTKLVDPQEEVCKIQARMQNREARWAEVDGYEPIPEEQYIRNG